MAARVENKIFEVVRVCRVHVKSWTQISEIIRVSKQAAWERFSDKIDSRSCQTLSPRRSVLRPHRTPRQKDSTVSCAYVPERFPLCCQEGLWSLVMARGRRSRDVDGAGS